MTESRIEEMKRKIAGLLAKAQSTEHEAEAEAFMAKAHELMERYQLDLGDVLTHDDPIAAEVGMSMSGGDFSWKRSLFCGVAKLYGCQPIICPEGSGSHGRPARYLVRVVGRESARVTLQLMWPFVAGQVREAGYDLSRRTKKSAASCMNSVGLALKLRINAMIREREAAAEAAPEGPAGHNALVTRDQVLAVYEREFPDATTRSRTIYTGASARELAAGIGLDRQVGGASQLRIGGGK